MCFKVPRRRRWRASSKNRTFWCSLSRRDTESDREKKKKIAVAIWVHGSTPPPKVASEQQKSHFLMFALAS